jgi:hypothetical protein
VLGFLVGGVGVRVSDNTTLPGARHLSFVLILTYTLPQFLPPEMSYLIRSHQGGVAAGEDMRNRAMLEVLPILFALPEVTRGWRHMAGLCQVSERMRGGTWVLFLFIVLLVESHMGGVQGR